MSLPYQQVVHQSFFKVYWQELMISYIALPNHIFFLQVWTSGQLVCEIFFTKQVVFRKLNIPVLTNSILSTAISLDFPLLFW